MSTKTATAPLFFPPAPRSGEGPASLLAFLAETLRLRPFPHEVVVDSAQRERTAPNHGWSGEDITGPVAGLFFACYAVREADGYRAYAKVCQSQPRDVWSAPALMKIAGPVCIDKAEAVRKVQKVARQKLGISADGKTMIRLVTGVERYQLRRPPATVPMPLVAA